MKTEEMMVAAKRRSRRRTDNLLSRSIIRFSCAAGPIKKNEPPNIRSYL